MGKVLSPFEKNLLTVGSLCLNLTSAILRVFVYAFSSLAGARNTLQSDIQRSNTCETREVGKIHRRSVRNLLASKFGLIACSHSELPADTLGYTNVWDGVSTWSLRRISHKLLLLSAPSKTPTIVVIGTINNVSKFCGEVNVG